MRAFAVKVFRRWYVKAGIADEALLESADEVAEGLVDASLGGNLYKKRVARPGQGKSKGFRTILAYQSDDRLFYLYGFAKNEKDNIRKEELKALKFIGKNLLEQSDERIELLLDLGELVELTRPEEEGEGDV